MEVQDSIGTVVAGGRTDGEEVSMGGVESALLLTTLAWAAICDMRTRTIPNRLIAGSVLGWSVCAVLSGSIQLAAGGITSALCVAGIPLCLEVASRHIRKESLIGGGDIKLLFAVGLYLPCEYALIGLFLACVVGLCMGIAVRKRTRYHPFGAAIAVGFSLSAMLTGYPLY